MPIDHAKYPFLVGLREYMATTYPGLSLADVAALSENVRRHALNRVEKAVRRGGRLPLDDARTTILGYYVAAMLVSASGSKWLARRFAVAESERAGEYMRREDPASLVEIARALGHDARLHEKSPLKILLGWRRGVEVYRVYMFSLSFPDYLMLSERFRGDPKWKFVNQPVRRGRVYLSSNERLARLLQESVELRIEKQLSSMPELPERLAPLLGDVLEILAQYGRSPKEEAGGLEGIGEEIVPDAFPPCIKELLAKASMGEHLSHHARFTLATFLLNIGVDVDHVVDVFRNMPDFKERITRYQVEHLAGLRGSGTKYKVYSCDKMRTLGLCVADCHAKTPLQAYRENLRRLRGKASK